jgi:putative heme degradation protein
VYYQLEIVIPGCNPTAFGFLSSRSNIANTGAIGFEQLNLDDVRVFPNPTDVGFTIQSRQVKAGTVVQFYDQMGRMVLSDFISGESTYMNTSALASGIYLLRIPAYPGFTKKISIQ